MKKYLLMILSVALILPAAFSSCSSDSDGEPSQPDIDKGTLVEGKYAIAVNVVKDGVTILKDHASFVTFTRIDNNNANFRIDPIAFDGGNVTFNTKVSLFSDNDKHISFRAGRAMAEYGSSYFVYELAGTYSSQNISFTINVIPGGNMADYTITGSGVKGFDILDFSDYVQGPYVASQSVQYSQHTYYTESGMTIRKVTHNNASIFFDNLSTGVMGTHDFEIFGVVLTGNDSHITMSARGFAPSFDNDSNYMEVAFDGAWVSGKISYTLKLGNSVIISGSANSGVITRMLSKEIAGNFDITAKLDPNVTLPYEVAVRGLPQPVVSLNIEEDNTTIVENKISVTSSTMVFDIIDARYTDIKDGKITVEFDATKIPCTLDLNGVFGDVNFGSGTISVPMEVTYSQLTEGATPDKYEVISEKVTGEIKYNGGNVAMTHILNMSCDVSFSFQQEGGATTPYDFTLSMNGLKTR